MVETRLTAWMPSIIMDALAMGGHAWSSMELERLAPPRSILNVGMVYFGRWLIRREGLMKHGPLVASIALIALAAQQAAQQ